MQVRRVVTGTNAEGKSVFASDERVDGITTELAPGVGLFTVPPDGNEPPADLEYVISGRVVLELDDGAQVELGPGDTVVQNGTRHAWRNPYDEPCRMVVVLVGATRR